MLNQSLKINPETKVFEDKKTHTRTIAVPFRLPDGTSAVCMICRMKNEAWEPNKIIKEIIIEYVEN